MRDDEAGTAVLNRTEPVPRRDRYGWAAVAMLAAGAFTIGTDMFAMAGILGGIARDLGVTVGTAGLTVTVFALASAAGGVLLSALLGARPLRRVLSSALTLYGVLSAATALAPAFPALLALRVPAAFAAAVYVPAAGAAAVAAVPESHRGRALGVILGGTSAATVLGAPLGVLLASVLFWRAVFGLVAALAAVTVLGLLRTGAGSGSLLRATVRERLRPLRSPAVTGTLAVTFLAMTASFSVYTYLPALPAVVAAPFGAGLFLSAFGAGGLAGTWWGGAAVDRFGPRRVVVQTVAVLAAGFAVLPLLTTPVGALAVVAGWGAAAWGFTIAQQHRLVGLGAGAAPLLLALNSAAINLGSAVGALAGGLVVDSAGSGLLWAPAVGCGTAGLLLYLILTRKSRS